MGFILMSRDKIVLACFFTYSGNKYVNCHHRLQKCGPKCVQCKLDIAGTTTEMHVLLF